MGALVVVHPHAHFTIDGDVIISDIHWRRK